METMDGIQGNVSESGSGFQPNSLLLTEFLDALVTSDLLYTIKQTDKQNEFAADWIKHR